LGDAPLLAAAIGLLVAGLYLTPGLACSLLARYREAQRAGRRAEALLRDLLTPTEYARLTTRGYLEVRSPSYPGRVYRVPRDGGIVVVYQNGRAVGGLCVHAVEPIPVPDTVAMHKLMIEGAEATYLQRANHLSVGALCRYGIGFVYER